MAKYYDETIPETTHRFKVVPRAISLEGPELDLGKGRVVIQLTNRLVDANNEPIKDEEDNFKYSPNYNVVLIDLANEEDVEIDGIKLSSVIDWVGKYFDQKINSLEESNG